MKEVVAKRYVKALISSVNSSDFDAVAADLKSIASAFSQPKMHLILNSPDKSSEQKVAFVQSLLGSPAAKTSDFLKVLASKKRLSFIPEISSEIERQRALRDGKFLGIITSDFELDSEQKAKITDGFSKKFGAKIEFESQISNENGIKIEVEGLGVEVALSTERLKTQMSQFILKAI